MKVKNRSNSRFYSVLAPIMLIGCCVPSGLLGGIDKLAEEVPARVFYLDVDGQHRPVVGVSTVDKIEVLLPDNKRKAFSYKSLAYAEKKLRPIGRLTVCGMEGRSLSGSYIYGDVVFNEANTNVHLKVIADRPIRDVYVVVSYKGLTRGGQDIITMGRLGDLPAGELVKRDVFLPNISIPDKTRYNVDFYSNGLPIEVFRLNTVADSPYTKSLLIPWEVRLGYYLQKARDSKKIQPKPFHLLISDNLRTACQETGIREIGLVVSVFEDGKVSLDKFIESPDPKVEKLVRQDIQHWLFFPVIIEGEPVKKSIKVPIRF